MDYVAQLCSLFSLKPWQAQNVISLLDEGNTIPFIARYRKEAHGSLDDQLLRQISDKLQYLRSLEEKREEIAGLMDGLGVLTDELSASLEAASTLTELEDLYRPYRPKRKTRASVAKEKGLAPLAEQLLEQKKDSPAPLTLAEGYVDAEKGVSTAEEALAGAMDIIAEQLSDDASIRKRLRVVCTAQGMVVSKAAKEGEPSVYEQYYDYQEPVSKIAPHRVLAINRGEKEGFLKVSITLDEEKGKHIVRSTVLQNNASPCCPVVQDACDDAYSRLIFPSTAREIRSTLTDNASEQAIEVFSSNLRHLLMQPPVKGKVAMGLDPGYRTGCKVAVVDETGRVLDTGIIYPTHSAAKVEEGRKLVLSFIQKYKVEIIAIGNGTASRETELFVAKTIAGCPQKVAYAIVNEAGASVYSASKLAAEEFPNFDLTLRSAVSIARRLQDPLAELVKIDPQSIGVGQYQHDMPKARLAQSLNSVVEDCVNTVGVDLNTASPSLLSQVSGISPTVAKNIVRYREENGKFVSRNELKKVQKLGPKAYEQCAGFLRILESDDILDRTAVHPESYKAARALLQLCSYTDEDVKAGRLSSLPQKVEELGEESVCSALGVGEYTLRDIIKELMQPGRDVRDELPPPLLRTDVLDLKDLKPGMRLTGTVRNVIDFGAFVDIGVHQDGLVHISQICNKFIKHPSEVLKVGDIVEVEVLSVDEQKKRIALTMRFEGKKPESTPCVG